MSAILASLAVTLELGFCYAVLAMGYYVTYSILDFPDLTPEGSFVTGAVVYGLLVTHNVSGYIALLLALCAGALAGIVTGVLHVRLKIRPLLAGILTSTALLTVNLVLTSAGVSGSFAGDGSSVVSFGRDARTLHASLPFSLIPARVGAFPLRDLILLACGAFLFKGLLDAYLKTSSGLLLRASGDNRRFVTSLSEKEGKLKIVGLAIGNGFAAASGALYTTVSGNANQGMGQGVIVIGLASLIIGTSLFRRAHRVRPTSAVLVGAILYQTALTLAQRVGIPSAYTKLIMAILFTLALVFGDRFRKGDEDDA